MHTEPITIDLDEDVLEAAREQAESAGEPLGKVISRLARHGFFVLRGPVSYPEGFEPLRRSEPLERIVTLGFVKRLEEEADLASLQAILNQEAPDVAPGNEQGLSRFIVGSQISRSLRSPIERRGPARRPTRTIGHGEFRRVGGRRRGR